MTRTPGVDRRRFLRRAAAASAPSLAALSGCITFNLPKNPASGSREHRRFVLGARQSGWLGIAPDSIREERNPELSMVPGRPVEITVRNIDGRRHQFVIENSLGKSLHEFPELTERGQAITRTVEPTQEMTTYLCDHYPVQMRGAMLVTRF